jgi:hypothetical protein
MNFDNEYLHKIVIDLTSRKIELHGSDGSNEVISDNNVGQFMSMLDYIKKHAPVNIVEYAQVA